MNTVSLLQKTFLSLFLVLLLCFSSEALTAMQAQDRILSTEIHKASLAELQEKFYKAEIEQEISVEIEDETLETALSHITRYTGLKLTYRGVGLVDKKVSLQSERISVSDALAFVLNDTGLDYKFSHDGYLLIAGDDEIIENIVYQDTVEGRVTDITTGQPLQGVNVVVKGTTTGTATNANGEFELAVESLEEVLVFSFIGYSTSEVAINGRTVINIEMESEAMLGEDLIVVGYGTQRKLDVTSSISSVDSEEFAGQPVQNIGQALQGKIAGVHIVQSSGSPGAPLNIRLRGIGTVNDSEPLYVIDGNSGADPNDLNPNQIESIQVLKSSSAAAIYGARGANGVVMITTKSGRLGTSNIDLNYYSGFQQVHNRIDMMNADQFARTYNTALRNAGIDPLYEEGVHGEGTDWQDAVFRDPAPVHNVDLSFSGGSEQGSYYISGGYFTQKGVAINSDYERLSFRVNSNYEINPAITIGQNLSISQSDRTSIPGEYGSRREIAQALRMDPTVPVKYEDGSWGFAQESDAQNPVAEAWSDDNRTKRPVLNGSLFVDIEPHSNLVFRSQINVNLASSRNTRFLKSYFVNSLQRNLISELIKSESETTFWDWNNTLTFNKNFEAHDFTILGGVTVLEENTETLTARGLNLPDNANIDPNLRYLNLAPDGQTVSGGGGEFGLVSFLGRINYGYNDRYLLTGNFRVDGSSKFGSENRWGVFPSFSIGWRISNENFMEDISFINELKLRGGWGQLGNQTTLPNYAFTSSLTPNQVYAIGDETLQGQAPVSVGNPELKWETTEETDIGVDFTGFENSITLEASYYYRKTSDMLLRVPVMGVTGITQAPFVNGGDVVNKGIELSIGYRKTTPGDFYYDVSFNISRNVNEVTSLNRQRAAIFSSVTRTIVGGPIGSFYGYTADGIFQNQQEVENHAFQTAGTAPGDIKFKDINGDGIIDQNDRSDIGNPWPDFTFGINSSINWKQFDLRLALQGVVGNDIYSSWKTFTQGSNFYNYDSAMLNAWNGEGTTNTFPRLNTNDPNDNFRTSSYLVEDGSHLRLKNFQLGYTFPSGSISNQIRNLRIYFSGQNLMTFTKYDGYDPEVGVVPGNPLHVGIDSARYPQPRTISIGLSLGI